MASTRIYRTAGTPTSQKKATVSFWVKMGNLTANEHIFDTYTDANNRSHIQFDDVDKIDVRFKVSGSNIGRIVCTPKFRDPTAWYHIVVTLDTTQATSTDRIKLYINGEQNTSADNGFTTETYPSQNADVNLSGTHTIGAYHNGGSPNLYFSGNLTHIHYTDGYAYAASDFGETDSTSGIWKPKTSPSGITYGTNGFFLKFENSGNLDLDSSTNNHTFATSGTITQNVDTPSNNFATLNPLQQNNTATTYSNGNTKGIGTSSTSNFSSTPATLAASVGKWYAEYKPNLSTTGSSISGFVNLDTANFNATDYYGGSNNMSAGLYDDAGQILHSTGTNLGSVGALSNGDIVMLAMDLDNGYLYWGKNGTWFNSANPATSGGTGGLALSNLGSNGTYTFLNGNRKSMGTEWNFGSGFFGTTAVASANADGNGVGAFEYAVPSGYYALSTKNIKDFG